MLYHLLYPLSQNISAFNIFRYITFRSITQNKTETSNVLQYIILVFVTI